VLTKDEKVVLHLHPHWKVMVRPVFVLLVAIAGVIFAAIAVSSNVVLLGIGVVAVVLVAWLSFWPWIKWRTTHYVFTTERVIMREGVFARDGRDIPLNRVNDVSFSHNFIERLLGCGKLTIESAGERGQIVLDDIPKVEKVQSQLYELTEANHTAHSFDDSDRDAIVRQLKESGD
jgi:uncharacterized membrane protein YdbT with pleckstrin-like domain